MENIHDVKRVYELSSDESGGGCPVCEESGGYSADQKVNHIIEEHGGTLLHVGPKTDHADAGLWHSTVYIVGITDTDPPLKDLGK